LPGIVDPSIGFAPGQIDELGRGALLALADMLPRAADAGRGAGEAAGSAEGATRPDLSIGFPRSPGFPALVGAVVRMLDLPPETVFDSVGPETVAVVDGEGTRASPLSLTIGVSVRDLSVVAPSGDRLMSVVLAAPEPEGAEMGPDFRGAYPPAVRSAAIPPGAPAHLGGLLGETPSVSWQFAPQEGSAWWMEPAGDEGELRWDGGGAPGLRDDGLIRAGAPGKARGAMRQPRDGSHSPWAMPGWWVARLAQRAEPGSASGGTSPDPAASLRAISEVLTRRRGERGVLTAGVARPALALAALAAVGVPLPEATRAIRWVDRVRWEGVLSEPGRLMIDVRIDLDPTKGAAAP
jgi:hypothetical protein